MEFFSLLFFGLLVGMQHALEADHLSAVAAMSTGSTSRRALILRGSFWGLGHTIALMTICGVLLLLEASISARTASMLELAVGAMIVLLGCNVIVRIFRERIHFHMHRHDRETVHVHVHSHAEENVAHSASSHDHEHNKKGMARAVLIGAVHGAAGSAGLLVLAATAQSLAAATSYVLAFGIGSILGMAAMSLIASYPLRIMEKYATWLNTATFACIGSVAILIGSGLIGDSWRQL